MSSIDFTSINKKVQNFKKSKEGKKKIEEAKNQAHYTSSVKQIVNSFLNTLLAEIKRTYAASPDKSSESSFIDIASEIINDAKTKKYEAKTESDGTMSVEIFFDENLLFRNSLLDTKTGKRTGSGVDNILALFNNGYKISASKTPRGLWESHGITVVAKRERQPLNFMQSSKETFLSSHKNDMGIKNIEISSQYEGGN